MIARLEQIADPAERLATLFRQALKGTLDGKVLAALAAADPSPVVTRALERVAAERVAFVARCYAELGHPADEARDRATVAYAAYLGVVTLRRHAGKVVPAAERDGFIATLVAMMLSR
ncbi:MAG: hypothetical protein U1F43_23725 [Myxococcota bacterium]